MKKVSFNAVLLTSILSVWMFSACNSDVKQPDGDSTAMENAVDTSNLEASDMPGEDDHYDFTYNYVDDEPISSSNSTTDGSKVKKTPESKTTPSKLKVKSTPVVYTVSQTDRPPLFSQDCLTAKNPQRCSNNALATWAKNSVKYPEADLAEGSDGLEYVTFIINKEGKVSSINRVESKKEACEGCSHAVLTAMLDMPDWQPAMLGGRPVNVVLTLPVRFRVL